MSVPPSDELLRHWATALLAKRKAAVPAAVLAAEAVLPGVDWLVAVRWPYGSAFLYDVPEVKALVDLLDDCVCLLGNLDVLRAGGDRADMRWPVDEPW